MSEINLLSILLGAMLVGCGSDPSTTVQMSDAGCNQPPDAASDETGADVVVQEEGHTSNDPWSTDPCFANGCMNWGTQTWQTYQ